MEKRVSDDVTAFVLTGGKSERMGTDKALLRLPSGGTLLEHALALCASVAAEVCTVGPRDRYAKYAWAGTIIEDLLPGHGPLGGIHAALSVSHTEWNLVLAVDTPLISPEFLRWLIDQAKASGAVVTVPRVTGQCQTLCAVYRREFKDVAFPTLEQNRNKIEPLYSTVTCRIVEESELNSAGFAADLFGNCNTAEDMAKLLATT